MPDVSSVALAGYPSEKELIPKTPNTIVSEAVKRLPPIVSEWTAKLFGLYVIVTAPGP